MVVGLMLTLRVWVMQVHTAIREDPAPQKKERSKPSETKNWKAKKLTYDERKQKLKVPLLPSVLPTAALCAAHMLLLPVWASGYMSVSFAEYINMQPYGGDFTSSKRSCSHFYIFVTGAPPDTQGGGRK